MLGAAERSLCGRREGAPLALALAGQSRAEQRHRQRRYAVFGGEHVALWLPADDAIMAGVSIATAKCDRGRGCGTASPRLTSSTTPGPLLVDEGA